MCGCVSGGVSEEGGKCISVSPVMIIDDETELSHCVLTNRGICLRRHASGRISMAYDTLCV